jgi:hypothetical protein
MLQVVKTSVATLLLFSVANHVACSKISVATLCATRKILAATYVATQLAQIMLQSNGVELELAKSVLRIC